MRCDRASRPLRGAESLVFDSLEVSADVEAGAAWDTFGNNLRSAMPHMLEAMKYTHKPLGTLKNSTPMKIIMYFIICCCMRLCSSVAGGVNNFCCIRNRKMVTIGRILK